MSLFPDEELPTIGFRGNKKIVIPQNVYDITNDQELIKDLDELARSWDDRRPKHIEQLKEKIEVLSEKIPDAIFNGTPQDLQRLLFDIDSLKSRLISEQSHLIRTLSNRLETESGMLDRVLGVSK
tara:strand:+ start:282 stop:656 length:375 start_codon:yes stop_codon:yes gene_type:complete